MAQAADDELAELRDLSARLGRDIARTQGAGGNTSIKRDGVMWVKASGTWLSQAQEREIFVPVSVEPLAASLLAGEQRADKATDFVVDDLNVSALRPSIETSVHAVIPQRVVAHFHCVNSIAHSVIENAKDILADRLAGLPNVTWTLIPYRRPGMPLAKEIAKVAAERFDVLILQNHGIVVCGDSVAAVDQLIEDVTAALAIAPRSGDTPDMAALEAFAQATPYQVPTAPEIHAIALDHETMRIAEGGPLYPDHVIFLGETLGHLSESASRSDLLAIAEDIQTAPKLIVVPGKGVLLSRDLSEGGIAMAQCLGEVTTRIDASARTTYLNDDDIYALTHWEAEQYRQKLDRQAGA